VVEITFDEFMDLFDDATGNTILKRAGDYQSTHLVLAEKLQMDASQFGARTAMCVGPNNTYQTVEQCAGQWIHDTPSQRQYFTKFAVVPASFR
jgi:hypothetical protein